MRTCDVCEPTTARKNAQLKQQIRLAQCVHPEASKIIRLLADDGFIEYCSDCMKITELYEPR